MASDGWHCPEQTHDTTYQLLPPRSSFFLLRDAHNNTKTILAVEESRSLLISGHLAPCRVFSAE
uniref:Bm13556 n=1 Tax=Brugia malayi TaxID=6279 RepID=A0A1I9G530_BRUMA|nr:Bm13556 [Brugia malayi]